MVLHSIKDVHYLDYYFLAEKPNLGKCFLSNNLLFYRSFVTHKLVSSFVDAEHNHFPPEHFLMGLVKRETFTDGRDQF